jgi:hypothetical protein
MRARAIRALSVISAFFKAPQCGTVISFKIPPGRVEHLAAGNNHNINTNQGFVDSKELSNQPFCSISRNRVSNFLAGGNTEPRRTHVVWEGETGHEPTANPGASIVDPCELRPSAQFHRDDDTVNRLRPFARLRLSTIRPFFVCIRTRNPWVRRRRRRLGWKVRFIEIP